MDKETNTIKVDGLNKLTRKVYWIASIAILLGMPALILFGGSNPETLWFSVGISMSSVGIILGITCLILATVARTEATTALERQEPVSFKLARIGYLLSIIAMIVIVTTWLVSGFAILSYLTNPANT